MPQPAASVGPAVTCGPFTLREIRYEPGCRQPPHTHDIANLTLVLAGSIRESSGSEVEIGSALSVVVKPAGVRHADEVGPRGAATLQLAFDARAIEPWSGDDRSLARWQWLHGRPPAAAMLELLRAFRDRGRDRPGLLEDRIVDVLGALPDEEPSSGTAPLWLRRIREALDDGALQPPPVRELAREADAHPVTVSRAFRRHFGCSITDYRRRQRLRRAAAQVVEPELPLSRVAHAAGYADQPHLTREFRRATGVTPAVYRRLAGPGTA